MNVVDEYLDANVEEPTSFVYEATTNKRNNISENIDKRGTQKILTQ